MTVFSLDLLRNRKGIEKTRSPRLAYLSHFCSAGLIKHTTGHLFHVSHCGQDEPPWPVAPRQSCLATGGAGRGEVGEYLAGRRLRTPPRWHCAAWRTPRGWAGPCSVPALPGCGSARRSAPPRSGWPRRCTPTPRSRKGRTEKRC